MVQVSIKNPAGKATGDVEVPTPETLTANDYGVVARAIERTRRNARKPWAHTKTRSEVSGGGKKPWRQKGTGRARAGSIRSPLWRHGGVTWGPRNTRNFATALNKKERRRAIRVALQDHAMRGTLILLDGLAITAPRTKDAIKVLADLGLSDKHVLVVLPNEDEGAGAIAVHKSFRNLPKVTVLPAARINVLELANHETILCSVGAWASIQALWFA